MGESCSETNWKLSKIVKIMKVIFFCVTFMRDLYELITFGSIIAFGDSLL